MSTKSDDLAAESTVDVIAPRPRLLINNEYVDAKSRKTFATYNPATGRLVADVAEAGPADVDLAVAAARQAYESGHWGRASPAERGMFLRRFAALIEANVDHLAHLETLDSGMTIHTARGMIAGSIDTLLHFAGAASAIHGMTPQSGANALHYSLREPVGVVGSIVPWNAPITNAIWKLGPALAAGNTIILKPAELTPLTALRLGELLLEADMPPGVVNILPGYGIGAGDSLANHRGIDKVSFTGSTEVGKSILRASAGDLKHVSLELGGKTPLVVFADADLASAVSTAVAAFTTLSGQICTAGSRLLVQRGIYDEFVDRLAAKVESLVVGDPLGDSTDVGPLVSSGQRDRVVSYLASGRETGAITVAGGDAIPGNGYFVAPTVFTGVKNTMRVAREEIFGPVVSVIPFDDDNDAVALANDTPYGLAASLWTQNLSRAHRITRQLKSGTVWVNTWGGLDPTMPFGGYKQSGIGREFGLDWYYAYTENKAVYVSL
ncbi:aldehyde dehydrogenase family protein [Sciscionella marina]|uniref:aldehyde dehydrogenase family protein n=1 Tax=Sciscionella marina TaxID=508770 RepID=UPI0003A722FD|nr:aldehyde dehydrogenase family protein [Sciscionella marina]